MEIHLLTVQALIASGNVKRFIGHEEVDRYNHDEGIVALRSTRDILDKAGVTYA